MTTAITDARRFKVERKGPFKVSNHAEDERYLVYVNHPTSNEYGWLHREGFFVDWRADEAAEFSVWKRTCDGLYFPTEAEATFRLLLHQNPREALGQFLKATGGEYEGTCKECGGDGAQWQPRPAGARAKVAGTCPTCHGTGGPPSRDLLGIAGDWWGDSMEAEVLHQLGSTK